LQQLLQILTDFNNFCIKLTRNELTYLSVSKCLTSPCVCKHTTLQNQKTTLFFTQALKCLH